MTSDAGDSTSTNIYELTCNDCMFEATVEGSVHDALDVADRHQDEHGETSMEHFVNLEID